MTSTPLKSRVHWPSSLDILPSTPIEEHVRILPSGFQCPFQYPPIPTQWATVFFSSSEGRCCTTRYRVRTYSFVSRGTGMRALSSIAAPRLIWNSPPLALDRVTGAMWRFFFFSLTRFRLSTARRTWYLSVGPASLLAAMPNPYSKGHSFNELLPPDSPPRDSRFSP